jgi:hypothetical protein
MCTSCIIQLSYFMSLFKITTQIIFHFHEENFTCLYLFICFNLSQCLLFAEEKTWHDKLIATYLYSDLAFRL